MRSPEELKQALDNAADRHREHILSIGDHILHHPELGFKEYGTAELVAKTFGELGLPYQSGLALTGVKAVLKGARPGPTLALLGELDALVVFDHPLANPETGAAHACGHNAQIAGLVGAAMALVETDAASNFDGDLAFVAVPAEEYVEVEYRTKLADGGKIEFLGGKPEMIRIGALDDADMAIMIHTSGSADDRKSGVPGSSNGCVVKLVRFIGQAAHAGAAPDKGINALNAAMLALSGIHAQRETFRDADTIRVHPIITRGGDLVNVIPSDVRMETYVRGKTNDAILDANGKVERALRAGALAMGAKVEIRTIPGYMPLLNDPALTEIFRANASALFGEDQVAEGGHRTGSTDMGDISHIMPALHPYIGGATGQAHSKDWRIVDPELAYLGPAKALARMAVDLLHRDAGRARQILNEAEAPMTKEEYLTHQRAINHLEVFDGGTAR